jgi:hypothetical protein
VGLVESERIGAAVSNYGCHGDVFLTWNESRVCVCRRVEGGPYGRRARCHGQLVGTSPRPQSGLARTDAGRLGIPATSGITADRSGNRCGTGQRKGPQQPRADRYCTVDRRVCYLHAPSHACRSPTPVPGPICQSRHRLPPRHALTRRLMADSKPRLSVGRSKV